MRSERDLAAHADGDQVLSGLPLDLQGAVTAAPANNIDESPARTDWKQVAIHIGTGLAAWSVIIFLVLRVIPSQDAEILLAITPGDPLSIAGTVLGSGKPISGHVQLVADNPKTSEHKVSTMVPVHTGSFNVVLDPHAKPDAPPEALRIRAHFVGTGADGSAVQGDAVAYAHCSSRINSETLFNGFIVLGVLAMLVTVLFTADLTQETAKFLFGASYLTCFLSVTAPVAALLVVSENRYLIELMRESPVGLVEARAPGLERPQWFLNVGGIVEEHTEPPWRARRAGRALAAQVAAGAPGEQTSEPKLGAATNEPQKAEPAIAYAINGGLAIPFYVIILAVFGAGISMMRNVPEIQKTHLSKLRETGRNPIIEVLLLLLAPFLKTTAGREELQEGCCVRKKIIDQYMYLLSAPFLAIAVYYLLQIVAQNVAEPVLVLMAFSAGLISERVVSAIVELADKTLSGSKTKTAEAAP
jgi:hypothetical protein